MMGTEKSNHNSKKDQEEVKAISQIPVNSAFTEHLLGMQLGFLESQHHV